MNSIKHTVGVVVIGGGTAVELDVALAEAVVDAVSVAPIVPVGTSVLVLLATGVFVLV